MIRAMLTLIACAVALGACSSATEKGLVATAAEFVSPAAEFTPPPRFQAQFATPRPVLDTELTDIGVSGKMILEQQTGPYASYLSSDLGGIVLQNGMLHSITGFGEPLMASDLTEPLALVLAGREGQADRFRTELDGQNRSVTRTFRCVITDQGSRPVAYATYTVQTRLMAEDCQSLDQSFQNLYFVDLRRREIIQSRQWVGPVLGNMATRVTRP